MRFFLLFLSCTALGEVQFEKINIQIGNAKIHAGIADTDEKRQHGLMFVKKMPVDEGMLFVFEEARPLGFWMKNTLIPLSIGFFDDSGALIDMQEMTPAPSLMIKNPPSYQSSGPALFALEMNAGWFTKNHVKKGAHLHLPGATKSALLKEKLSSGLSSSHTTSH